MRFLFLISSKHWNNRETVEYSTSIIEPLQIFQSISGPNKEFLKNPQTRKNDFSMSAFVAQQFILLLLDDCTLRALYASYKTKIDISNFI